MKNMFITLKEWAKEDPKEFIGSVLFVAGLFVTLWASLWFAAIIEGRV